MNKRKIRYLGITGVLAFGILILFHLYTLQVLETGSRDYRHALYRLIAYQRLIDTLRKSENLFNQTPLISLPENFDYYLGRLQKTLDESQRILGIIKDGGVLTVDFPLNLAGSDRVTQTIRITGGVLSENDLQNLVAGFQLLRQMYTQERKLLEQRFSAVDQEKPYTAFASTGWEFVIFGKKIDSIFRRMIENANSIYYYNQRIIEQIRDTQAKWVLFSRRAEFILFILILGVMLIIAYYYTRDLREKNRQLKEKIYTDELTGLPTRYHLQDHFNPNASSCLALLDLQNFARIVSLYGSSFADKILQQAAQRLRRALIGRQCELFRYAEDIFGIYEENKGPEDRNIKERVEGIREALEIPEYIVDGVSINLHCIIGAAEGVNCKEEAFIALHNAKHDSRPFSIYRDGKYQKTLISTLEWERKIDCALATDNLYPYAQPIVDRDGHITGYETLMRLREEREGESPIDHPPVFLAIAKNTNRYLALSKQMLRKAFAACESMKHFSINLGKEEIKSPEIWTLLETLILRHNAQGRVVFEILEHDYFEDTEEVSHFVNHFKKLGVKIAIDDFGSGYSSFRRVLGLRPHILKIDGNIIRDLPHSPDNKKLVELIVEFARSMGIKTVAEFVENEEIFHEARMLGIDYFQGYHFGRPRSCEEIS